jgi:hypothetical protein
VFYAWWRGDPLPDLGVLPRFQAERAADLETLARVNRLDDAEVQRRVEAGHRPYLAWLGERPVGYGWSATTEASIGEQGIRLVLPPGNRYLWDFATLPEWRGQRMYPRLLQAILRAEQAEAERFWIGHDASNVASARGILAAGFHPAGDVVLLEDGAVVMLPGHSPERAEAGAALLGMALWREDRP